MRARQDNDVQTQRLNLHFNDSQKSVATRRAARAADADADADVEAGRAKSYRRVKR